MIGDRVQQAESGTPMAGVVGEGMIVGVAVGSGVAVGGSVGASVAGG